MTPKEKAQKLVDKFQAISGFIRFSKAYAIIAVDELISYSNEWDDSVYWTQVKFEIQAL
jgi:hypothetical protein